jgi:hypothetical protein
MIVRESIPPERLRATKPFWSRMRVAAAADLALIIDAGGASLDCERRYDQGLFVLIW